MNSALRTSGAIDNAGAVTCTRVDESVMQVRATDYGSVVVRPPFTNQLRTNATTPIRKMYPLTMQDGMCCSYVATVW